MRAELDVMKLINEYVNEGVSASELAKKYKTYTNKILRALRSAGINIKDKSTVQKEAFEKGRKPPMKGKKHKADIKDKIGKSMMDRYDALSDAEKEKLRDTHKELWKNRKPEDIESMRSKGAAAIRKASEEGSKLEKFLYDNLRKENKFSVHMHQNVTENVKLEVDLIINKVAVEVQGPSHYEPIWGQEKFNKTITADIEKRNLLMSYGYSVIYIKNIGKRKSDTYYKAVLELLIKTVKEVQGKKMFKEIEYNG